MWGFPLQVKKIRRHMHKGKAVLPTMDAALIAARTQKCPTIYKCVFGDHYHISNHIYTHRYGIEAIIARTVLSRAGTKVTVT